MKAECEICKSTEIKYLNTADAFYNRELKIWTIWCFACSRKEFLKIMEIRKMSQHEYGNEQCPNEAGKVYPVKKAVDLPHEKTDGDKTAANYSDF